jgi:hypothetical protein
VSPLALYLVLGEHLPRRGNAAVAYVLDPLQYFLQQGNVDVLTLEAVVVTPG